MKMRLAVPTNSVSASARPFLDRHQLTRFFEVSVTGDEIERGKPHPDIYLCAVERRGVPPDACLVIEDALPGIVAKAAKKLLNARRYSVQARICDVLAGTSGLRSTEYPNPLIFL